MTYETVVKAIKGHRGEICVMMATRGDLHFVRVYKSDLLRVLDSLETDQEINADLAGEESIERESGLRFHESAGVLFVEPESEEPVSESDHDAPSRRLMAI